jgi:hypothetical protein
MAQTCLLQTVYETQGLDIQYCADCGLLHVSLGSMTLRMSETQFEHLVADLSQARQAFTQLRWTSTPIHVLM